MQRLGPIFVKIGQFLALRPDLIPQEYCDEFLKLTDQVEAFPIALVQQIVKEDLGGSLESHFSYFNPRPLAAASLSQVHDARTLDNVRVAVKVQRAGIHAAVKRDLRTARILGGLLKVTGSTVVIDPSSLVEELARWMDDELDLHRELGNLTRMHWLAREERKMRIPQPFPELSGKRVLTAEYLPGVPLTALLRYVRTNRLDRIAELGFDHQKLAENLLETVLTQVFRFEFFQADTHPGNFVALPDNVIGFVDFGLTETLDPTFRKGMIRYLSSVYSGDVEGMLSGLSELLVPGPDSNPNKFRTDFYEQDRLWRSQSAVGPRRAGRESPTARYLVGVLRAAHENNYIVPQGILSLYRALLTAETLASQLGGTADLGDVGSRIFQELQIESAIRAMRPENIQATVAEALLFARDAPRQVRQILTELVDGRYVLAVQTEESASDRKHANTRARLIAACVLAIALAVLFPAGDRVTLPWGLHWSWIIWTALALDWIWVVVLWRRLS